MEGRVITHVIQMFWGVYDIKILRNNNYLQSLVESGVS